MCGIFGVIGEGEGTEEIIKRLSKFAEKRGKDSSGILYYNEHYNINKADFSITKLIKKINFKNSKVFLGIGRLITNDNMENQPYSEGEVCVFHNGIIVNDSNIFKNENIKRKSNLDTEIFHALTKKYICNKDIDVDKIKNILFNKCFGTFSIALALPKLGKLILSSNHGSLYYGEKKNLIIFSSEKFHLHSLNCKKIKKLNNKLKILNIPQSDRLPITIKEFKVNRINLVPKNNFLDTDRNLLAQDFPTLVRCTKCLLPHTFPFIKFNEEGVCNYCLNHKKKSKLKPKEELFKILEYYRKKNKEDCIVPFSGGRDSSYALHIIVKELNMKPITFTYDWGMTSDIGRRNISRVCSKLKVENIIVSADIQFKRKNIRKNILAWLKNPHLGMVNLFTAGDKHFYKYIEEVKKQTTIKLNLWGYSPFEVTHFKSGFLGYPPDFDMDRIYSHGVIKQIKYQYLRAKAFVANPSYFNMSIWDTLSGEYYRSFKKKQDYHYIYDYWSWNERLINKTLIKEYDWELADDTNTTWRIGDGTAGFYNYIYYTIAGFTEHDTFRSNQIREGVMSRQEGLKLVEEENRPRYQNIAQYLEVLNLDFKTVIETINNVPKLWHQNPM
ncbi:MAG: glucosamine 6-phosphate synthetase [Alphaproteobacteria bacterium TMED62]|nr:MAG: glucosamine 6-phosphate synthetase [Alphaproteobacteria bacterium TMED62]|tara:strand:- start:4788 stop:6623 length:1836 start_codon:yes stop_codon:yes gene_type:complete